MAWGQVIWVANEAAPSLLQRVWTEMDYGLDVCHVTNDGHTQHLSRMPKKNGEFLFPSVGRQLPSFPPFKYTDFVKCVRELWITLYNLDFILQMFEVNLIWRFHSYPNYIFSCRILTIISKFLLKAITEYHMNVKARHNSQHAGLHVWAT